jgi:hypothetical protein
MTLNVRLLLWALAAVGVTLAATFGPFVAGFAFAGAALAFVLVLMAVHAARAIDDWRLEHPWLSRRTRSHTKWEAHEERRAA